MITHKRFEINATSVKRYIPYFRILSKTKHLTILRNTFNIDEGFYMVTSEEKMNGYIKGIKKKVKQIEESKKEITNLHLHLSTIKSKIKDEAVLKHCKVLERKQKRNWTAHDKWLHGVAQELRLEYIKQVPILKRLKRIT